jgi:hypothetical protein
MTLYILILAVAACAALNAFRGAGFGWLRPVIGLAAGLASYFAGSPIITAGIVAGGVWLWLTQPWGRWYMIGQGERDWAGTPDWWEKPIERLADRAFPDQRSLADALAWFISGTVFALPLIVLASPLWAVLTPVTIGIYALSLAVIKLGPHVRVGEIGKGAFIGLLAVLLAGCAIPYREPQPDWGGISREVGRILNQ